jgi:hypothetical protein
MPVLVRGHVDERAPLQIPTSSPWTNSERYRPNSRVSGLERAAQPGYRSAAWSLSASWMVSSAAGSASKRSSGMGGRCGSTGRRCRLQAVGEHDPGPRVGPADQRPRRRRRLVQPVAAPDQPCRPSRVRPHGHPFRQSRGRPAVAAPAPAPRPVTLGPVPVPSDRTSVVSIVAPAAKPLRIACPSGVSGGGSARPGWQPSRSRGLEARWAASRGDRAACRRLEPCGIAKASIGWDNKSLHQYRGRDYRRRHSRGCGPREL